MMISLKRMAEELGKHDSYRIYYHKQPDGDAIGSAFALALGLRSAGHRCAVFCCDPLPEKYENLVDGLENDELCGDVRNIAVDSAGPKRLGVFSDIPMDFCIDHHENNGFSDALQYVEEDASSCAQVILKLMNEMQVPVTGRMADLLFTGLVTDTSSFRSLSTNAASFEAAARLAALGADAAGLARRYCLMKNPQRLRIEQILMNSFRYTCGGKVLGSMFTYDEMMNAGIQDRELEGLNAIVEQVEGVEIGIVVREIRPGECRISIRTGEKYNAAELCAAFGGGGHAHAAGCSLTALPEETLRRVQDMCDQAFSAAQKKDHGE